MGNWIWDRQLELNLATEGVVGSNPFVSALADLPHTRAHAHTYAHNLFAALRWRRPRAGRVSVRYAGQLLGPPAGDRSSLGRRRPLLRAHMSATEGRALRSLHPASGGAQARWKADPNTERRGGALSGLTCVDMR